MSTSEFIDQQHVAFICLAVVASAVAVGLGVGLSRPPCSVVDPSAEPPEPTAGPVPPPVQRGPCTPSNDSTGGWGDFRLPDYVKPVHYDLHLLPDLITDVYQGSVAIHLEVSRPTRHLWLHIRETFVTAVPRLQLVTQGGQKEVGVKACFEYKPQEYVVVEATEELPATGPGEMYILSLDFRGWLNGSVVGFYRVIYTEDGIIAATDHEPTDARKSFPCFDEPNKKSTYQISITHDHTYKALSNMPQKSVPMSTYLVCFAVHQFHHVERISAKGVPLRIYAQPSQIRTADYAANTTKIIFDYFEEYFNMTYSIGKLDKIAIPDFGTGAMENWGLITYRENNLLYDEEESSSYNKQRVASVIAHELVHQWFGNIVTMDWWDDLWLNEGFASFFEYIGVEKAEPTWGMRDIMLISDVLPVMVDDALLSSHPIIVDVSTPAEITSVFDGISYSKGASILRMLEDWMGKDNFRDGCRKYLKDNQFKNAKTEDFWASLASVNGLPVAEVMDTWTKQMGYPVLDLFISGRAATLTQKRFLLDPKADPSQPPSPLGSDILNGFRNLFLLNSIIVTDVSIQTVVTLVFDAADRTGYVDDVFALARAGLVDYGTAFNLTKYLRSEEDYIVWDRLASSIAYVRDMLSDTTLYPTFQKLFRDLVFPITTKLGWKDDGTQTQTERLLRETVLGIACQMEDPIATAQASEFFDQWIVGNISRVSVNLRLLVYRYGMRNSGTEDKWNVMFQKYKDSTLAQEKDKLLYGLASVKDVNLLYKLLEATKDESVMRSQDLFTVVRYVSLNPLGSSMAWDWATLNWDYLVNRYTINDRNLGRLLSRITTTYNTEVQLWKMEHFFKLRPNAGAGEMPRKQALETVRNNIEWIRTNKEAIRLWLETNVA
uniref:Aminopeptidase n=1 Tax=Gadus morhua TaxID=8049 RepID=A0A8C5CFU6_GADMO